MPISRGMTRSGIDPTRDSRHLGARAPEWSNLEGRRSRLEWHHGHCWSCKYPRVNPVLSVSMATARVLSIIYTVKLSAVVRDAEPKPVSEPDSTPIVTGFMVPPIA